MSDRKEEPAGKAKPHGNQDPRMPKSPDVKQEEWSAEKVAEQGVYKDSTEVKEEMKQGQQTQREDDKDA